MEKTFGEKRVRTSFNVTGSGLIDDIKQGTAQLINLVEGIKKYGLAVDGSSRTEGKPILINSGEQLRLISLAQTAFEEAAMWSVKACTI